MIGTQHNVLIDVPLAAISCGGRCTYFNTASPMHQAPCHRLRQHCEKRLIHLCMLSGAVCTARDGLHCGSSIPLQRCILAGRPHAGYWCLQRRRPGCVKSAMGLAQPPRPHSNAVSRCMPGGPHDTHRGAVRHCICGLLGSRDFVVCPGSHSWRDHHSERRTGDVHSIMHMAPAVQDLPQQQQQQQWQLRGNRRCSHAQQRRTSFAWHRGWS